MNAILRSLHVLVVGLTLVCGAFAGAVELKDVSQQFTYQNDIVSPFPNLYQDYLNAPDAAGNDRLYAFQYSVKSASPRQALDDIYRVEVYITIGDEMDYGITYFITDAKQAPLTLSIPKVYLIEDMSAQDGFSGQKAPRIDPFDREMVATYIRDSFLTENGMVMASQVPSCKSLSDYFRKILPCMDTRAHLEKLARENPR